ncbi:hypothetical protein EVG20_g10152, partial [Dentipellis fragilis]
AANSPEDGEDAEQDAPVPFPRAVSSDHSQGSPSPDGEAPSGRDKDKDKDRLPRGRFQSEVDGASSRRRPRPNSYDEFGGKPARRSRFESMVNLGVGSSNASASDLLLRDSMDGSAVRQTLIVKEEGKTSTQYFGSVYRALNLNTGQMVAVKRIGLEGLKEEEVTQLMREVDLVKSLSHPSIVKYEGMARDEMTLSIVLEYAENGSLGQTLKAFGKLNERLVASYVVKILEGLHYLHRSDVVHCDLKAANILTTKNGNVKLSDFGVSLNLRAMEREIKDVAGTPNWMAPEVIELKGASPKSDIWSLACTVIELLTGRPPYGDIANSMTVMFRIVEDEMPPLPEGCSPALTDFLQLCFNKDPSLRPGADLLCEHEWLKTHWGLAAASSNGPSSPVTSATPDNDFAIREHTFVKTTFSKRRAPPTCDLRSQLLLYAQFAERGTPVDFISAARGTATATTPASDGFGASSSRASLDSAPSPPPLQSGLVNPPSAYKVPHPFKRSRASLSPEPARSASSASLAHGTSNKSPVLREENVIRRKLSILIRNKDPKPQRERPRSVSSISTARNTSSMRSMTTTGESLSSRSRHANNSGIRSAGSVVDTDHSVTFSDGGRSEADDVQRGSKMSGYSGPSTIPDHGEEVAAAGVPGGLPPTDTRRGTTKRGRDAKGSKDSKDGCVVQ